ncbi:MAG: DUF1015 domain-containing protein [Acidobacteriota bacterium]
MQSIPDARTVLYNFRMAKIFPFRGYRFNSAKITGTGDVVTQPYDRISPEMLDRYLAKSPYNVAHIIKTANHSQAGRDLRKWIREGVLQQDPSPSFYPYQQVFEFEGVGKARLGFIGLIGLRQPDLQVRGHEEILPAPLQDRLHLIRETRSNEGLVFSLYSDPTLSIDELLGRFTKAHPPTLEVEDEFGTLNRLWRLSDPALQANLMKDFRPFSLYIADGHHRFQTSLLYMRECLEQGWKCHSVEGYDKRMMAFFNMDSPALAILPTHRAVRNVPSFDPSSFLSQLESVFEVVPQNSLDELRAAMEGRVGALGLVIGAPYGIFLLRARARQVSLSRETGSVSEELDVSILHRHILEPFLGIGPNQLKGQRNVDYYRDEKRMISRLQEGLYQAAFLLNPTTLEQVRKVADAGLKMPQKSTDFYPKLLTGLVFMKMKMDRS